MTTAADMFAVEARQEAVVRRAQSIIDSRLATMSTRQALIDLCGNEHDAEMLAEKHDGYHKALEWEALRVADLKQREESAI